MLIYLSLIMLETIMFIKSYLNPFLEPTNIEQWESLA